MGTTRLPRPYPQSEHLTAVHRGISGGVDFETQRRVPKETACWYRQVLAANGLP